MSVLFVTLFDKNYLVKGISMIDSLLGNSIEHKILILSLDVKTYETLNAYFTKNDRIVIKQIDFISPQILTKISNDRSYREFCWALSSILSYTTLTKQNLDVIYLDADLYFFNSVELLISKCVMYNAAITPHRFSEIYRQLE
jgi:lipopolysaccharide biosynthesis glycosyltransferase